MPNAWSNLEFLPRFLPEFNVLKSKQPLAFVSPLDWGIGHASRLIPIIHQLIADDYQVIIGGSGKSGELLKKTFPQLPFRIIKSNEITYNAEGPWLAVSLAAQIPAIIRTAFREHSLIRKWVADLGIDVIISDNRYGLFCKSAYSILITHQISPVMPFFLKWAEFPVYCIIRLFIRQFDECWIPDFSDPQYNLTGKLSHRFRIPGNARFIGILSRFDYPTGHEEHHSENNYQLVVVLSGPQPQLRILTEIVYRLAAKSALKTLVIGGLQNNPPATLANDQPNITFVQHLMAEEFRDVLLYAECIISRSGYSGLMDLLALGRTAVIIPTPGQCEQEYLASYLEEKGLFTRISHQDFQNKDLRVIIHEHPSFCSRLQQYRQIATLPLLKKYQQHNQEAQHKTSINL